MAMGIKQIDDTALLKKSIKIKEKQKQKSTIAWCVGIWNSHGTTMRPVISIVTPIGYLPACALGCWRVYCY